MKQYRSKWWHSLVQMLVTRHQTLRLPNTMSIQPQLLLDNGILSPCRSQSHMSRMAQINCPKGWGIHTSLKIVLVIRVGWSRGYTPTGLLLAVPLKVALNQSRIMISISMRSSLRASIRSSASCCCFMGSFCCSLSRWSNCSFCCRVVTSCLRCCSTASCS